MIKLENINYRYGHRYALNNINININEGESIALIGPNGSGKSTFLKLLNGIIFPEKGSYFFNQEEITEKKLNNSIRSKEFHRKIGFVFQSSDTQLFCSTVYEEIAFGPRQMGFSEEKVNARVYSCLQMLNIEKLKHEPPYNLSGGEKKRVAIASVLSMNPDIITLDEPMNGIDPKGKNFLRELFIKLNASGKTIICSTHDFEYVDGMFKRAVVFSYNHNIIRDDNYYAVINDENFLVENNIK